MQELGYELGLALHAQLFKERPHLVAHGMNGCAAQAGNVAAQNRLAKLYMRGIGTEPNSIDAAAWYFLARRAGLKDPEMEDFLRGLTEEEQKQALARANRLR